MSSAPHSTDAARDPAGDPPRDPAGVPYHALRAALSPHPWWRVVIETLCVLSLWFLLAAASWLAVAGLAALAGDEVVDLQPSHIAWQLASLSLGLAVLVPAVMLAARWLQGRPAGSVSSMAGRLRWRWLVACAGWAALALALVVVCQLLVAPGTDESPGEWAGWSVYGPTLAVVALLTPLQAAGEEYFFRGWLLQALSGRKRGPWIAVAVSSALFVAAHGRTEPLVAADLAAVALAASYVTIRTGGLEAAIALHAVNNTFGLALDALDGSLVMPDSATPDLAGTALQMAGIIAYAAWIARVAERRGISDRAR
jgi:uncharacterized protein